MNATSASISSQTDPCPAPLHAELGAAAYNAWGQRVGKFSANLETLPDATTDDGTMAWWSGQPEAWKRARERPRDPKSVMEDFHLFALGDRAAHPSEAPYLAAPDRKAILIEPYATENMFTALPPSGFDQGRYEILPAPVTRLIEDGDVLELGDRHVKVLHTPGHSPGSIALWEAASGVPRDAHAGAEPEAACQRAAAVESPGQ